MGYFLLFAFFLFFYKLYQNTQDSTTINFIIKLKIAKKAKIIIKF